MQIEFRELTYFLAVAEEGSFSAAAERLHMTQPPLSQAIAKLERSLGTRLFEREARRPPRLSHRGTLLLAEARRILQHVRELETLMSDEKAEWWLRIGAIPSVISGLMTSVVRQLRVDHPELRLLLSETEERDFLGAIRSWSVDVGFTRALDLAPGQRRIPLLLEPLYAALPDDHKLAQQERLRVADLERSNFVMFYRDEAPHAYDHIMRACIRSGFSPRIVLSARNDLALLNFVACGLVVTLVPFLTTQTAVPGVVYRQVDDWATTPLSLVYRDDSDNPYVRVFERAVRSRLLELAAEAGIEMRTRF